MCMVSIVSMCMSVPASQGPCSIAGHVCRMCMLGWSSASTVLHVPVCWPFKRIQLEAWHGHALSYVLCAIACHRHVCRSWS